MCTPTLGGEKNMRILFYFNSLETSQANTRKILASALSDPLEEGQLLFERQVEETQLEGRRKQRRRLLDLSEQGVQVRQVQVYR